MHLTAREDTAGFPLRRLLEDRGDVRKDVVLLALLYYELHIAWGGDEWRRRLFSRSRRGALNVFISDHIIHDGAKSCLRSAYGGLSVREMLSIVIV